MCARVPVLIKTYIIFLQKTNCSQKQEKLFAHNIILLKHSLLMRKCTIYVLAR